MTLGRIAYETGRVGPLGWDDLPARTREYWERVGQAVAREVRSRVALAHAEESAAARARFAELAESGKTSPIQMWGR